MKRSGISQIAVLFGLAIGLIVLLAGSIPVGVSGELFTGGWTPYTRSGWPRPC